MGIGSRFVARIIQRIEVYCIEWLFTAVLITGFGIDFGIHHRTRNLSRYLAGYCCTRSLAAKEKQDLFAIEQRSQSADERMEARGGGRKADQ